MTSFRLRRRWRLRRGPVPPVLRGRDAPALPELPTAPVTGPQAHGVYGSRFYQLAAAGLSAAHLGQYDQAEEAARRLPSLARMRKDGGRAHDVLPYGDHGRGDRGAPLGDILRYVTDERGSFHCAPTIVAEDAGAPPDTRMRLSPVLLLLVTGVNAQRWKEQARAAHKGEAPG